jgi:tetratricopeptide (TPR) repeat protein
LLLGIHALLVARRVSDAQALAGRATLRFPLIAKVWLARADVAAAQHDVAAESEALRNAVGSAPLDVGCVMRWTAVLLQKKDWEESERVIRRALARSPLAPGLRVELARCLYLRGQKEEACRELQRTATLSPGYRRAWELLDEWHREVGTAPSPVELAQELTTRYPWNPELLVASSRVASALGDHDGDARIRPSNCGQALGLVDEPPRCSRVRAMTKRSCPRLRRGGHDWNSRERRRGFIRNAATCSFDRKCALLKRNQDIGGDGAKRWYSNGGIGPSGKRERHCSHCILPTANRWDFLHSAVVKGTWTQP